MVVDAYGDRMTDGGSIPPSSTDRRLLGRRSARLWVATTGFRWQVPTNTLAAGWSGITTGSDRRCPLTASLLRGLQDLERFADALAVDRFFATVQA